MLAHTNHSIRKNLYTCLVALALVSGFFSGSIASPLSFKHKAQTEWIALKQPRSQKSFYKNHTDQSDLLQPDTYRLLFQNSVVDLNFKTNQKQVDSFSVLTCYFSKQLPPSDEDLIFT